MADRDSKTRLHGLPLRISACVCERSLSLKQLLEWQPGTVLTFDQDASAPLKLAIGDRTLGTGHAVTVHGNFGIRLSQVGGDAQ